MRSPGELLPVQFRILYRHFLLRVIDLEALSVEADVPRFLGQFASVLILISVARALGLLMAESAVSATPEAYVAFAWQNEQALISGTMLVVGLIAIFSWDSILPDRRDVMVLSPLPVAPHTLLFAKVAGSATLLGVAVLTLNFATGFALPLYLASHQDSNWGFFPAFAAYWLTMIAGSLFIFCAVLTVQGLGALFLPRGLFLRVSALLQIAAFGLLLGAYFLQPSLITRAAMTAPGNHSLLTWSPSFWFFAGFHQLNGSLPADLAWMAARGWFGLALVISGAIGSLLLCYLRTMKRTIEQPDLVARSRSFPWAPRFGSALATAVVLFSFRSLTRSRQHRLAFAFYVALMVLIALPWRLREVPSATRRPVSPEFLVATFMMMSFAVFGMRSVFLRPISLAANWLLRITQLYPAEEYVAASRRTLLVLAVVPVWIISALWSFSFAPWQQIGTHLTVLALMGWVFVELGLVGFYKVPFTCSYLPGKLHVQVVFLYYLILLLVFAMLCAEYELPWLNDPLRRVCMISIVGAVALGLWAINHYRAKSAIVAFEEIPPKVILTLGLTAGR